METTKTNVKAVVLQEPFGLMKNDLTVWNVGRSVPTIWTVAVLGYVAETMEAVTTSV